MLIRRTPSVLVLDGDPDARALVKGALAAEGYRVFSTADPGTAARVAQVEATDLIFTDVSMSAIDVVPHWERRQDDPAAPPLALPDSDGYAILRALERAPDTTRYPIVLLKATSADGQTRSRFGVVDFVPKPVDTRTLCRKVEDILKETITHTEPPLPAEASQAPQSDAAAAAAAAPACPRFEGVVEPPPAAMQGRLSLLGVPSLLQMWHSSQVTGVLTARDEPRAIEIHFRNGEIVAARSSAAEGAPVVLDLIGWADGWFEFIQQDVPPTPPLTESFEFLLLEGCRRLDENRRAAMVERAAAAASGGAGRPASDLDAPL